MDELMMAKLARLQNRHTRYEIVAVKGSERVLVGYSTRKGRSGLISMARQNGEKFARYFQSDALTWGKRASDGATCGEWTVNFSGRTQREAILSGELTFFARLLTQSETLSGRGLIFPSLNLS